MLSAGAHPTRVRARLLALLLLPVVTGCPPWVVPDDWDCNANPHAVECEPVERQPTRPDGAPEGENIDGAGGNLS